MYLKDTPCKQCPKAKIPEGILDATTQKIMSDPVLADVMSDPVQGYLAHQKQPLSLGPLQGPRHIPAVGSSGGAVSYERGTPVRPQHLLQPSTAPTTEDCWSPYSKCGFLNRNVSKHYLYQDKVI